MVFWFKSPLDLRVVEVAVILYFLGAIRVIIITYISYIYSLKLVIFLALYLNVTLLLNLVTIYIYYYRTGLDMITCLICSLLAFKLALIVLKEISKQSLIITKNRN